MLISGASMRSAEDWRMLLALNRLPYLISTPKPIATGGLLRGAEIKTRATDILIERS
jgi:hypothetical protein